MKEFSKELNKAMNELDITQTQVAEITGIGKSSISQYLSGKNEPSDRRKRAIANALGLHSDYFSDEQKTEVVAINPETEIKKMDVCDASRLLGISHITLRKGLQQGVFPWGYAIQTSPNRWVYFINAARFAAIEGIKI